MDNLTARPRILKQANLSLIRKVIKIKKTATRAEIADETKISSTTVRSLLSEMLQNGEIESIGYDESSGGRKAERYRFKPDRYYGAAFCIRDDQIHCLLINVCGEVLESSCLDVPNHDYEKAVIPILDRLTAQKEVKAIGIGVPGIVKGGTYWKKDLCTDEMHQAEIGNNLSKKYGIPVVLENDLNAITIGFCQCYEKDFPSDFHENTSLAYIHFDKGCISAGFISGGKIIRGSSNFAGELGLLPIITKPDGKPERAVPLEKCLTESLDDISYTNLIIKILSWICGILNPQYIALAGPGLRKNCLGPINDGLFSLLPGPMLAEVVYSGDVWHDYYSGMAYLTAGKMFEDIQLIKE